MKYEQKSVYVVTDAYGEVVRVFGIKSTAEDYAKALGLTVDVWPVDFEVAK